MPITNVIVNGTFDISQNPDGTSPPGFAWTGTDLEAENHEHQYLGGPDTDDGVAEMDGENTDITVMEQSFVIDNPTSTTLTLESALRSTGSPAPVAGVDGFTIEILDSSNVVIATTTVFPTSSTMTEFTLDVTFPSAGTYTLRFTEVGNNDSFGAIVDDIELLVCFTTGVMIDTKSGAVPVETIKTGDMVKTADGYAPVRWVGKRSISAAELFENSNLRPVKITAGSLGEGLPTSDLLISRQHRMLANGPVVKRMFGCDNVLIAAAKLITMPGIFVDENVEAVTYFHLLFDRHEIVYANGSPSESLFTGPEAFKAMSDDARTEILTIFPELKDLDYAPEAAALIPGGSRQKRLVHRHTENSKPLYQVC